MYICKPERNIRQVKLLLFASVIVTLLLFFVSSVSLEYSGLVRIVAYVALIAAIWLNVRYSLTEFEYAVSDGSFSVTKTVGNRRQIICNVALETVTDLLEKRDYVHLPSNEKAILKYSLNQNMRAKSYVLLCNFNGKRTMIEFEPNGEFVAILKNEISRMNGITDTN